MSSESPFSNYITILPMVYLQKKKLYNDGFKKIPS